MLNSGVLLLSGEVGAKRKRRYGNILPPLVVPYTNGADLGTWSLVLIQFSCPEVKPKFACQLRRCTPTFDGRNSVFNPGCVVRVEVWWMVFLCRNYRSK